jgi:hypothetical protein
MLLYKFLEAGYALQDIEAGRIKISQFYELNDSADLEPFDSSHPSYIYGNSKSFGLLCLSRSWSHPLLWGHYGQGDRGVCLGFDVPDADAKKGTVNYVCEKMRLTDNNWGEMFLTKSQHWSYEEEVRLFAILNRRCDDDFRKAIDGKPIVYTHPFSDQFRLREVIVGWKSWITQRMVEDALAVGSKIVEGTGYSGVEIFGTLSPDMNFERGKRVLKDIVSNATESRQDEASSSL